MERVSKLVVVFFFRISNNIFLGFKRTINGVHSLVQGEDFPRKIMQLMNEIEHFLGCHYCVISITNTSNSFISVYFILC